MDLTLALLADYANLSQEGKLNVLGVFDTIYAHRFPAIHPELRLVLRFEAGPAERGTSKTIEIKLLDSDKVIAHLRGSMEIPAESDQLVTRFNEILTLQHLHFERPGDYRFDVLVNGETKGPGLPFRVVLVPTVDEQNDRG